MNNQIVPVLSGELSGVVVPLVDAMQLYEYLGVSSHFKDWIANRIKDYGFSRDRDFLFFESEFIKTPRHGFRSTKARYHITLDMAKELGMIEGGEKGRQIRRYFLDMEREVKLGQAKATPPLSLQLLAAYEKTIFKYELIQLSDNEVAGELVQTVSARDLWKFLDAGRDFSNWINGRIDEYGFLEGVDFVVPSSQFLPPKNEPETAPEKRQNLTNQLIQFCSPNFSGSTPLLGTGDILAAKTGQDGEGLVSFAGAMEGGENKIEYHLTIDMAKELGMIERTPKGRQIRRYFLDMERAAKAKVAPPPDVPPHSVLLANLAQEFRSIYPKARVTDSGILSSKLATDAEGKQVQMFYRTMGALGLPSVVVIDVRPYLVKFEWYESYMHTKETYEAVRRTLELVCEGHKNSAGRKAFKHGCGSVDVMGLKTVQETQALAQAMQEAALGAIRRTTGCM